MQEGALLEGVKWPWTPRFRPPYEGPPRRRQHGRRQRGRRPRRGGGDRDTPRRLARLGERLAVAFTDDRRRRLFLALFVGLDRRAEGYGTRALEHDPDRRALRPPRPWNPRRRCRILGGQAFLRLRPRQRAFFPAGGRRDHDSHGRTFDAGRRVQAPDRASGDDLLRRSDAFCSHARGARFSRARGAQAASVRVRRRAAAGGNRPPLSRPDRSRHPGRHRLDGDAAYFPVQSRRRRPLRHDRRARSRLRAAHRRRAGARRRRGRAGRAPDQGSDFGDDVLEQSAEVARHLHGRVDA